MTTSLRRFRLSTALPLFLALSTALPHSSSAAEARTVTTGPYLVIVDGFQCSSVRSASGGNLVASVVNNGTSKHVSNVNIAPITLVLQQPLQPNITTLINDFLAGTTHTVDVSLDDQSGNGLSARQASLTEVTFSDLGGALKEPATVSLTFQPEQVSTIEAGRGSAAAHVGGKTKAGLKSNFRITAGNLPTNRIASVGAITFKRAASEQTGTFHESTPALGALSVSNVEIQISVADKTNWIAFEKSWFVEGHHLAADELTIDVELLEPDLTHPYLKLRLKNSGLISLARPEHEANSEKIDRLTAQFYIEGAELIDLTGETPTAPTPTPANRAPTPAPTAAPTAVPTTPPTPTADRNAASGMPTPLPVVDRAGPAGERLPVPSPRPAGPVKRTVSLPDTEPVGKRPGNFPRTTDGVSALPLQRQPLLARTKGADEGQPEGLLAAATASADDQGARDPSDFPRISGLRRVSYNSYAAESRLEETATYETKMTMDETANAFAEAVKGAGWEVLSRTDGGSSSDNSQSVRIKAVRTVQNADIQLSIARPGVVQVRCDLVADRRGVLTAIIGSFKGIDPGEFKGEGSPNDLGGKDPAKFPRPAKTVRKSYYSYGNPVSEETVTYRAKISILEAEGFYMNQLTDGDWEAGPRRENGDPQSASHEVSLIFTQGLRTATIRLTEVEAEVTQISVTVKTSTP